MNPRALLTIFLVVFVDLVGFGIVIPILPYYAQEYGASGWHIGWLMACYSIMQFLLAPIWGRVSDYFGRKPVLAISVLGACISLFMMGSASSLKALFIARTLAGIFGANISTAYAYITDISDETNRAKGMGIIGASFGLGFIFGPAIGGLLSRYGYGFPMYVGSALALTNFFFILLFLKEPFETADERALKRSQPINTHLIRHLFHDSRAFVATTVFFFLTFAVTQMEVCFAIFMKARYGFSATEAGVVLAMMGVIMAVIQGMMIGELSRKFGESTLILVGLAICSVALYLFSSAAYVALSIMGLTVLAVGHGILHPSLSSLASKGAPPDMRGAVMGIFHSSSALARVVGPPVAGWLYDTASWRSPFLWGSVVLVAGFLLMGSWRLKTQSQFDRHGQKLV